MFAIDVAGALVTVAALAVVAWRLGEVLLARALPPSPERELAGTALGLGLISHAIFALGLAGALGRWLPIALVLVAALLVPSLRPRLLAWRRARRTWIVLALVLLPLGLTLLPPTAFDATMYHLAYAKTYAYAHRVSPVWHIRYPVFPQLNEMLFTVAHLGGGAIAAALVQTVLASLTAAALYTWGARHVSPRAGTLAAALWLGNPMIVFLGTSGYIDAGLACFATLATLALGSAWRARDDRWIIVAAALAGCAADCKYLGLPFVALLGLCVPFVAQRRLRASLLYGLVALALLLPWYVYNFVYTHNPVFPFAARWFGLGPWNAEDLALQLVDMRSYGVGKSGRALLLLPWALTVAQRRFLCEAPFLPLFLPALLLALWGARVDRVIRALMLIVLAYGLFWLSSMQLLRYLVPASALFALAVASSIDRLLPPRFTRVTVALLVAPAILYALAVLRDGFPVTTAGRDAYLARKLPGYAALRLLNGTVGPGYRAYGLRLTRLAYFADGALLGDWFGAARYREVYARLDDATALATHLAGLGAQYLLVPAADAPLAKWRAPDFAARFELLDTSDDVALLRLR
jgi:4-amino-4-deoxy-L-arabinose transferase-like glycosyltransferase